MIHQENILERDDMEDISQIAREFNSNTEKKQLQQIPTLVNSGNLGLEVLKEFLISNKSQPANIVIAKAYQEIYLTNIQENQEFLQTHYPSGVIKPESEKNINYQPLQQLLIERKYQAADTCTREKLWELAGESAMQRKWLYFTEVKKFPIIDLQTIDRLWNLYSEGKFGFSTQRKIWLSVGKDWTKLWEKINWKTGNKWTLYPKEFIWDLSAPIGHLPLSNQLRGVQVIASLFAHPAWLKD